MLLYATIAIVIFIVNVFPVFMPATWTLLAFAAVRFGANVVPLAIVGALAATAGRVVLARLAATFIRTGFLSEKTRRNVDQVRTYLEKHHPFAFGLFLAYAFSPFPSNQLFLAYGLTDAPIRLVAIPFAIGRLASYAVLASLVTAASFHVKASSLGRAFGGYFIIGQLVTIGLVWLFTRIDWKELTKNRRVRLLEKK